MIDLLRTQSDYQIQASQRETAASILAIGLILMDKGICTADEYMATRSRAVAMLDQEMARQNEERLAIYGPP